MYKLNKLNNKQQQLNLKHIKIRSHDFDWKKENIRMTTSMARLEQMLELPNALPALELPHPVYQKRRN